MFENETRRIKPVVKDLTAHNMPSHTPAVCVALVAKPVMTKNLRVKVVCLKRRVMNMHLGALEKEEAVVINEIVASVQSEEDGNVDTLVVVHELFGQPTSRQT